MSEEINKLIETIGPANFAMAVEDLTQMIMNENDGLIAALCPCPVHHTQGGTFIHWCANQLDSTVMGVDGWIVSMEIESYKLFSQLLWDNTELCIAYASVLSTVYNDFIQSIGGTIDHISNN